MDKMKQDKVTIVVDIKNNQVKGCCCCIMASGEVTFLGLARAIRFWGCPLEQG